MLKARRYVISKEARTILMADLSIETMEFSKPQTDILKGLNENKFSA